MIRTVLSLVVRSFLEHAALLLKRKRTIYDREGGSPYLTRYYLFGGPRNVDEAFDELGTAKKDAKWKQPVNLYLHHFHRSDDAGELHNHPWDWSCALILAGGYVEERWVGGTPPSPPPGASYGHYPAGIVQTRVVLPFTLNLILGSDYHRVDLVEKDAWSLFLAGPKSSSWGFWNRHHGQKTPWRDYITKLRGPGWEKSAS